MRARLLGLCCVLGTYLNALQCISYYIITVRKGLHPMSDFLEELC